MSSDESASQLSLTHCRHKALEGARTLPAFVYVLGPEASSLAAGPTLRQFLKREGALIYYPCACIIISILIIIIDLNFCIPALNEIDAALE